MSEYQALSKLIDAKGAVDEEIFINGLSIFSKQIKPGHGFVALPGTNSHGADYVDEAIEKGAKVILCDDSLKVASKKSVPVIYLANLTHQLGYIAARFYGQPSMGMEVIGVTGTNGKTSCSQFIATALTNLSIPCGIIGTLGNGFPDKLNHSIFTTPDAISLQSCLQSLQQQGAKAVAMEVSSHGLAQGRVNGVNYKTAILTNLTRDHLDYHKTMAAYKAAKQRLFEFPSIETAIINYDDDFGKELIAKLPKHLNIISYSQITAKADVYATDTVLYPHGVQSVVHTPWGNGELQSKLPGRFNLSNCLAVIAALSCQGVTLPAALEQISQLNGVPGRMETFGGGGQPVVVVDYSHTPDALLTALRALREHCQGTLWCVFGCGGDRDKGKRSHMGAIAEQYADEVIVTNDNPRSEQPQKIIDDIMQGINNKSVTVELNRAHAIKYAIEQANPEDIILVAGKGHECYQQVGSNKHHFSDREEVLKALGGTL